jgi:hypothetical protein
MGPSEAGVASQSLPIPPAVARSKDRLMALSESSACGCDGPQPRQGRRLSRRHRDGKPVVLAGNGLCQSKALCLKASANLQYRYCLLLAWNFPGRGGQQQELILLGR